MTGLRIPAIPGGKASVRLVYQDDQDRQVLGFEGPEWATAYAALDLSVAATIELTPTADIATADGRATCYLITATAPGGRAWQDCVQVPDSPDVQELRDLVGGAAVDSADILAGRLLPTPADLPDGNWLTTDSGAWIPTDAPPGSGIPDAPLTGGPFGRKEGGWVNTIDAVFSGLDHLAVVDALPVTPDPGTVYIIEGSPDLGPAIRLSPESVIPIDSWAAVNEMPVSPDPSTVYFLIGD